MKKRVVILEGDGIGPEIIAEAVRVLVEAARVHRVDLDVSKALIGGASIDAHGTPLTDEVIALCKEADGVLLGAVGGPAWDGCEGSKRPEAGLLQLRKAMGLYANLRPMTLHPNLLDCSPLKWEAGSVLPDLLMVRELTGGIYFGERGGGNDDQGAYAWDTERYSEYEVDRISHLAFRLAKQRACSQKHSRVHSVDKANVLDSSRLWRKHVEKAHQAFVDTELNHMYVDNCAMQLILNPGQFDVILTSNMFGDILSDEMSALGGSIGLMPSASLGDTHRGMYEPIHGSAPDLAGLDQANPAGTILSAAMLARYSLEAPEVAKTIETAVERVIASGFVTQDLRGSGRTVVGTKKFGDLVLKELDSER